MATKLTDTQIDFCMKANEEDAIQGHTDKHCPICGGKLTFARIGNSGTIRCEKDGCVKINYRGL
ncbi:MAG: hypothetical protein RR797_06370 [Christensenella sp.]